MLKEVNLTPKPGLVDRYSNGAHKDMTLQHFHASAQAIEPYFSQFIIAGIESHQLTESQILARIRPIGVLCEKAMLEATDNVNTHKGSIFSLGLVCAAIGRLLGLNKAITPELICRYSALFCDGLVERELKQHNERVTAGQRLFIEHGLTGARGEAESGFKTVLDISLPVYLKHREQNNHNDELALHQALLHLMASNDDTNVVSRGGIGGLIWLQQRSHQLIQAGGIKHTDYIILLQQFDADCIEKNLSPGGCADLLILTWFFGQLFTK